MITREILIQILELARWAPSGDNSQPWTFRIASDDQIEISGIDHSDTDVYDFDARPTLLTLGFLIESIAIAASKFAGQIEWSYRLDGPHGHRIDVTVLPTEAGPADPLLPFLETRSVARGRYKSDALTMAQKLSLESSLASDLDIRWFETRSEKMRIAKLNAQSTHIRLSIPEAFTVHKRILDWKNDRSPEGVPAKAIALDPMTLASMRWVMQKWERAHFMNRFAGGTVVPRLEMDLLPGFFCAAHFMVFQPAVASDLEVPDRLLTSGRSLQRFWLTAESLGLVMQPSLAPLCFAHYAKHERPFTTDATMRTNASTLGRELEQTARQASHAELVFMGRIGLPTSLVLGPRSVRKPLSSLLMASD